MKRLAPSVRLVPHAASGAMFLAALLASGSVHALGLGRMAVMSTLGEPLLAEVDLIDASAAELASFKAHLGGPEAYRAAGIDYAAAVPDVRMSVQRRADGQAVLRLVSDKPVTSSFVELVLESQWQGGQVTTFNTLMMQPAGARTPKAVAPTLAQTGGAASATTPASASSSPPPAVVPSTVAVKPAPLAPALVQGADSTHPTLRHTVKPGDTAIGIVRPVKPPTVSLDQMLVALLRTNAQAFVENNVHRLKLGAVLTLPDAAQAQALSPTEATEVLVAQSKDFDAYRQQLAAAVPGVPTAADAKRVNGAIGARMEERQAAAPAPDKLKLSKAEAAKPGTLPDAVTTAAQTFNKKHTEQRIAELSRNIEGLQSLGAAAKGAAPVAPPPVATQPAGPAKPTEPAAAVSSTPATVNTAGVTAAARAQATASPAPAGLSAALPGAGEPTGWFDGWLVHPAWSGLGLLAVLAALFAGRQRAAANGPTVARRHLRVMK